MTNNQKVGWKLDNSYARLPETFFTDVMPSSVRSPRLVILNQDVAESLGLSVEALQSVDGIAVLSGNKVPEDATPLAQAYAGHQFGHFTMLGDGRAVLLGEQITPAGERVDIQLKGAGRTPYSRGGDGRAALGPMLREYIISEGMHGLGIPTTRSLAVVSTGEPIIRETELPGAVLTRVAASHIRVGTFQYVAKWCGVEELKILADYTITRHYPEVKQSATPYLTLLQEVIKRQAYLIAKWQLVGFIHGVMNTDNMTISGETIDYGPCAFMDTYDQATVFSSIDTQGRYAYGNQPYMGVWNLARFAETLIPLLDEDDEKALKLAQEEISKFADLYQANWLTGMRAKLGLFHHEEQDETLIKRLLEMMGKYKADYTNTFRALTIENFNDESALLSSEEFMDWKTEWEQRLSRQEESKGSSQQLMKQSNPSVIPRNHRVEEALKAAEDGDFTVMERLLKILADPYAYSPDQEEYCKRPTTKIPYRTFCGT